MLVSRLEVDIYSTFCDGFMVLCVKLMQTTYLHLYPAVLCTIRKAAALHYCYVTCREIYFL